MTMTRILTVEDLNEEKSNKFKICPIAISRVLKSMLNISIWLDLKFLLLAASEAFVYASCFIPFIFIKGMATEN